MYQLSCYLQEIKGGSEGFLVSTFSFSDDYRSLSHFLGSISPLVSLS